MISYGLGEIAQTRRVKWGWSADGAGMTILRKHTSVGGQPLDIEAKHPITGEIIFHDCFNKQGQVVLKTTTLRK